MEEEGVQVLGPRPPMVMPPVEREDAEEVLARQEPARVDVIQLLLEGSLCN